jgi:hypothetical protein
MIWPGMGDPYKRKKTLKFLLITAIIAISVAVVSTFAQAALNPNDPLKVCINERITPYKIKVSLELFVDGEKANIPANIGFSEECKRSMYTLTDDGTIYVEWDEEYAFEIGHFLWMWEFPIKDMDQSKSKIFVNGKESEHFISHPLQDGYHYKAEFTSKAFDESKDTDFLPEK